GKELVAIAKKSKSCSAGKGGSGKTDPGDHAHPVNFAFYCGQQNQRQRQDSSQPQRQVKSPADARRVANEHVGKPRRNRRRADKHEVAESQKIAGQRQTPGTAAEQAVDLREDQGYDEISNQEGNRTAPLEGNG